VGEGGRGVPQRTRRGARRFPGGFRGRGAPSRAGPERNARGDGASWMFSSTEELVTELGILGALWRPLDDGGERLPLLDLPARNASPYDPSRCLGRYWTEDGPRTWARISPASAPPRFPTRLPRRRE
jgi:hypothetical protein